MSRDCSFCGDCEACQRTLRNEGELTKLRKRVAELDAAGRLADHAIRGDPWRQVSRGLWKCDYCRATGEWDNRRPLSETINPDTVLKHSQGCLWETYRAAVAAISAERSAGTVPPAPKPVADAEVRESEAWVKSLIGADPSFPSPAEHGKYLRDGYRNTPKPAPACARCGGSGEIDDPVTINPACGGYVESSSPCPACRGTP